MFTLENFQRGILTNAHVSLTPLHTDKRPGFVSGELRRKIECNFVNWRYVHAGVAVNFRARGGFMTGSMCGRVSRWRESVPQPAAVHRLPLHRIQEVSPCKDDVDIWFPFVENVFYWKWPGSECVGLGWFRICKLFLCVGTLNEYIIEGIPWLIFNTISLLQPTILESRNRTPSKPTLCLLIASVCACAPGD